MTLVHCVGTEMGCNHVMTVSFDYSTRVGERRFMDWYIGRNGNATCVCCAQRGATMPERDGVRCEPFACDRSIDRCTRCFTPNGQHVANCDNRNRRD